MSWVYALDYDGTLAHSLAYRVDGDSCVETINGVPHGYMSCKMVESLRAANSDPSCTVAIVTSRSESQFLRIEWPEGAAPKYAFVDNGAYLLSGERFDTRTELYSARKYCQGIEAALTMSGNVEGVRRCALVDESYALVIVDNEVAAVALSGIASKLNLTYDRVGRKAYFFPPGLDKSIAAAQLRNMGYTNIVAAGDGINDIPLLKAADIALLPESFRGSTGRMPWAQVCDVGVSYEEFVAGWISGHWRKSIHERSSDDNH